MIFKENFLKFIKIFFLLFIVILVAFLLGSVLIYHESDLYSIEQLLLLSILSSVIVSFLVVFFLFIITIIASLNKHFAYAVLGLLILLTALYGYHFILSISILFHNDSLEISLDSYVSTFFTFMAILVAIFVPLIITYINKKHTDELIQQQYKIRHKPMLNYSIENNRHDHYRFIQVVNLADTIIIPIKLKARKEWKMPEDLNPISKNQKFKIKIPLLGTVENENKIEKSQKEKIVFEFKNALNIIYRQEIEISFPKGKIKITSIKDAEEVI